MERDSRNVMKWGFITLLLFGCTTGGRPYQVSSNMYVTPGECDFSIASHLQSTKCAYRYKWVQAVGKNWRYPEEAREARQQGSVGFRININPSSGQLVDVTITRSSGYLILDQATMKAVVHAPPVGPVPKELKPTDPYVISGTHTYQLEAHEKASP